MESMTLIHTAVESYYLKDCSSMHTDAEVNPIKPSGFYFLVSIHRIVLSVSQAAFEKQERRTASCKNAGTHVCMCTHQYSNVSKTFTLFKAQTKLVGQMETLYSSTDNYFYPSQKIN